jgi:hypothetical protein
MLDNFIDRVGDWNPQLFRELRGRLTGTSIVLAIALSLLVQLCGAALFTSHNGSLSDRLASGFTFLNWAIPTCLILGGVYTIAADLQREDKQGTLNFLRLTPQRAYSLFLGKMLGAPSLLYLGVAVTVPLHLLLGILSGASIFKLMAWYGGVLSIAYLFGTIAVLYTLLGGKHAILLALIFTIPTYLILGGYSFFLFSIFDTPATTFGKQPSWFGIPIFTNAWAFSALIIGTLLTISYWFWVAIERKYINPLSTAFTKKQSYVANGQVQLYLLGFALPILLDNGSTIANDRSLLVTSFYTAGIVWILLSIAFILPHRVSMQEWSASRQSLLSLDYRSWRQPEIIQDLRWHDRSPIVLAVLINLALAAVVWGLLGVIFIRDLIATFQFIVGILSVSLVVFLQSIYIVVSLGLSSRLKSNPFAMSILMSYLPLVLGGMFAIFSGGQIVGTMFVMFTPFSWLAIGQLPIWLVGLITLGQLAMSISACKNLARKVTQLGNVLSPQESLSRLRAGSNSYL